MDVYKEQQKWIETLHSIKSSDHEVSHYNEIAHDYDRLNGQDVYQAPHDFGQVILEFEEMQGEKIPRNGKTLDVGAGTGKGGHVLRNMMNFTGPIDALEPSSEMWTIGQKTGIYSRYFDEPILENEVSGLPANEYDFVYSVGCFNDRSLRFRCLKELIRVTKKGGYVGTIMNRIYFLGGFQAYMYGLADAGVIEIKVEKLLDQFINNFSGAAVIVKKL